MAGSKKVLIIDDEIDLSLLLRDYFLRKHYDVTIAHSIEEGQAVLADMAPDIVFLDNNLPDGTGWSLAADLATKHPEVFIFLVSAFHPVVPQMPAGANFMVVEKPISLAVLDKQFAAV
jgi:DNA-binding response OmpR family regulator